MVFTELSSDSSNSIGVVVGFAFRLAGGVPTEDATSRGSLEAGGALLGAGRAGSGGGPCGGGKAPKADVGCRNKLRCGEA